MPVALKRVSATSGFVTSQPFQLAADRRVSECEQRDQTVRIGMRNRPGKAEAQCMPPYRCLPYPTRR